MTHFRMWVSACEEFGTKVALLEGRGDTAVYKTWNEYLQGNAYFRTDPVFHVWKNGIRIYCGLSYRNADRMYHKSRLQNGGAMEKIEITCGNCKNNEDGFCDALGRLVEDDDSPHCKAEWEAKNDGR